MNCQTCQTELEDLLYGELDTARAAILRDHLSVCGDCRQVQLALERENEIFATYYEQTALEPADEMWQAIQTRIKDEVAPTTQSQSGWIAKLQGFFLPLFAPAMLRQIGFALVLIVASVGLTALFFSLRNEEKQIVQVTPAVAPSPAITATPNPSGPNPSGSPKPAMPVAPPKASSKQQLAVGKAPAPDKPRVAPKLSEEELLTQQIAIATREYQGAIKLLERTIAKRKTDLDEGTIKQFESSLAMIDASIASSRQAMQAHPNDPTAARFLLAAYSKKVELMQEIAMR